MEHSTPEPEPEPETTACPGNARCSHPEPEPEDNEIMCKEGETINISVC